MAERRVCVRVAAAALLLCLHLAWAQAGKLLVVPADGSHWTGLKPLVEELGGRGHEVVVLIPEVSMAMGPAEHCTTLRYPVPYTKDQILSIQKANLERLMALHYSNALSRLWNYYETLDVLKNYTRNACESLLYNHEIMHILENWHFDALLTDPFVPQGIILGAHLDVPSIFIQNNLPCGLDHHGTQSPHPPSYVPTTFSHLTDHMSLGERAFNFLLAVMEPFSCQYLYASVNELASDFLKRQTTIQELVGRASIWLMRWNWVFEFPKPIMPNMIIIGAMDCAKTKPLPLVSITRITKNSNVTENSLIVIVFYDHKARCMYCFQNLSQN